MAGYAVIGGTGALGAALGKRLAAIGETVWIGSRDPSKAAEVATDLMAHYPGARVEGVGMAEAAANADVCILTVPYAAHAHTIALIKAGAQGKIVVDTTVPLRPPKVGTVQLPAAGSAAVEAAALLGESVRTVSALQTIGAEKLGSGGYVDGDVLVAGDDSAAVDVICALLERLGLKSWNVGPLANSAAAEAMTSLLIQINRRYKIAQAGVRITGKPKAAVDEGAARTVTVQAVTGLPLLEAGDDLARLLGHRIAMSSGPLQDGDVVVVAQKIISKVEGRRVALASVTASGEVQQAAETSGKPPALVELIKRESQELMRVVPGIIITRTRTGHVLANAGIDASNVVSDDGQDVLLWPEDPDASAHRLREALESRFGARIAVIISDSLGRAWRMGTTGTAIGVSGLRPINDRRGERDLFGRTLQATIVGVADEIAGAASLVIGEGAEGLPAAIVRGANYVRDETAGIASILRPIDEDLFR